MQQSTKRRDRSPVSSGVAVALAIAAPLLAITGSFAFAADDPQAATATAEQAAATPSAGTGDQKDAKKDGTKDGTPMDPAAGQQQAATDTQPKPPEQPPPAMETMQPPAVQPPAVQPPAVQPPAVQPPVGQPQQPGADQLDAPDAPNGPRANVVVSGALVDLDPAIGPFDGASATLSARQTAATESTIKLSVTGAMAGGNTLVYGAHVHTGPCVAMNGPAAGPHFAVAAPPSPSTEVWLDLPLDSDGATDTEVTVPFVVPPGGAQSVVIHAVPTAANGTAGARVACLPIRF